MNIIVLDLVIYQYNIDKADEFHMEEKSGINISSVGGDVIGVGVSGRSIKLL